jgi:hypothetical protein
MKKELSLIREKCIAANPEIMELKFGCEVGTVTGSEGYLRGPILRKSGPGFDTEWGYFNPISPNVDVLGRPVRLADVLVAYIHFGAPAQIVADAKKHLDNELQIVFSWNLRADDLEKQSDETISFLYDLLK